MTAKLFYKFKLSEWTDATKAGKEHAIVFLTDETGSKIVKIATRGLLLDPSALAPIQTIEAGTTAGTIKVNGTEVAVGTITGADVNLSDAYATATSYTVPAKGDSLDTAISKLAKGIEDAAAGGVQSVGGATSAVQLAANATEVQLAATTGANGTLSATLVDGGVSTAKIADSAVTTAKILDANVTADKLAADSVTTAKIADGNVTLAKVSTDAIQAGTKTTGDDAKLATKSYVDDTVTVTGASGYLKVDNKNVVVDTDKVTHATDQTTYTNDNIALTCYVDEKVAGAIAGGVKYKGATATIPTGTPENGDMWKLTADITSPAAKAGDVIIYNGTSKAWEVIPAGDDVEYTGVKVGSTIVISATTGGDVTFAAGTTADGGTALIDVVGDGTAKTVTYKSTKALEDAVAKANAITVSATDGVSDGTNTYKYEHKTYTAAASDLYLTTVDGTGHVSEVTAVTEENFWGN